MKMTKQVPKGAITGRIGRYEDITWIQPVATDQVYANNSVLCKLKSLIVGVFRHLSSMLVSTH